MFHTTNSEELGKTTEKNELKATEKNVGNKIYLVAHPLTENEEGYFLIFDGLVSISKNPVLDEITKICPMNMPNSFANCAREKLYSNSLQGFDFVVSMGNYDIPIGRFAEYYQNAKSDVVDRKADAGEITREYLSSLYAHIANQMKNIEEESDIPDTEKVFLSPRSIVDKWEEDKAKHAKLSNKRNKNLRNNPNKNSHYQSDKKKGFFQKNWIWILLIAIAVGYLIYRNRKKQE